MAQVAAPSLTQKVSGWAARDSSGKITPFNFKRRENGIDDVTVQILFCGMCHSDIHLVKNQWNTTIYPVVPGHEMTGVITKVGSNAKEFKVGDRVGVGNIALTCMTCEFCLSNHENYCDKIVYTYNSSLPDGTVTRGGYSHNIVIHHRYVVKIPNNLPLDATAPLLCAGVTVYTALKDNNFHRSPGRKIGVAGLGGLGHLAVKFGKACGHHVTVISSTPSKESDAKEHLGADDFILSTDPQQMESARKTLDLMIIYTVSSKPKFEPILDLLKVNGIVAAVAEPAEPYEFHSSSFIFGKRSVKGSVIGSISETSEMLELCSKHNILCDIEVITPDKINEVVNRVLKKDVRYRFVIDIASSDVRETPSN